MVTSGQHKETVKVFWQFSKSDVRIVIWQIQKNRRQLDSAKQLTYNNEHTLIINIFMWMCLSDYN